MAEPVVSMPGVPLPPVVDGGLFSAGSFVDDGEPIPGSAVLTTVQPRTLSIDVEFDPVQAATVYRVLSGHPHGRHYAENLTPGLVRTVGGLKARAWIDEFASKPYVYGGGLASGDCSGFMRAAALGAAGQLPELPRESWWGRARRRIRLWWYDR